MMQMRKKTISQVIGLAALLVAGVQAQAQTGGLEEMVVTAQKREQSLQQAPIAISAFSRANSSTGSIAHLRLARGSLSPTAVDARLTGFCPKAGSLSACRPVRPDRRGL